MNRQLELLIALSALLVATPILVVVWIVILATLGRPVFFFQHRAGRGGTTIRLMKFRTMTDERDAAGELLPDAERETPTTKLIHRIRVDELPQLFAIVSGKMSLVGPRPLLPSTIEELGAIGQMRCSVKPGLTGWAQVSGNTNLSLDEKLQLDLWYVSHRSLGLDLRILVETIAVAAFGERRNPDRLETAANWLAANPVEGSIAT